MNAEIIGLRCRAQLQNPNILTRGTDKTSEIRISRIVAKEWRKDVDEWRIM